MSRPLVASNRPVCWVHPDWQEINPFPELTEKQIRQGLRVSPDYYLSPQDSKVSSQYAMTWDEIASRISAEEWKALGR